MHSVDRLLHFLYLNKTAQVGAWSAAEASLLPTVSETKFLSEAPAGTSLDSILDTSDSSDHHQVKASQKKRPPRPLSRQTKPQKTTIELELSGHRKEASLVGSDEFHLTSIDEANAQGYFKETDILGDTYECVGLYSRDVAYAWSLSHRSALPNAHHQSILCALNLQSVLSRAISMDAEIAWKGSMCTLREKVESERRLVLCKRSLLRLSTAFVQGCRPNQIAMFDNLEGLKLLATPSAFRKEELSSGLDERKAAVLSGELSDLTDASLDKKWPFTCEEIAQDLISQIFKGNEELCDKVPLDLLELFGSLANAHLPCPSSSPALDFFFIVIQPEKFPLRDAQMRVCKILLDHEHYPNLADAVRRSLSTQSMTDSTLKDPSRLIKLLTLCMIGGNEVVASDLTQQASLTIDSTCIALISLTKKNSDDQEATSLVMQEADGSVIAGILQGGFGNILLELLVEQTMLQPMNQKQLVSPIFWEFISNVATPVLDHYSSSHSPLQPTELACCEAFFDLLERTFSLIARLGLLSDVTSDKVR